jgi:hypothetical protein
MSDMKRFMEGIKRESRRRKVKEGLGKDVYHGAKVGAISGQMKMAKNATIGTVGGQMGHVAGAIGGGLFGAGKAALPHIKKLVTR